MEPCIDDIYTRAWYEEQIQKPGVEAEYFAMADVIEQTFPDYLSVVEVGCGPGFTIERLRQLGWTASGYDGAKGALSFISEHYPMLNVKRIDLRTAKLSKEEYDLVICTEVAEHLAAPYAQMLCTRLALHTEKQGRVVFTAAPPGQGGTDHCNEQPMSYWIERMSAAGLEPDPVNTEKLREGWRPLLTKHIPHMWKNVQVFKCST
jgi:SAM-dependent methyltransferase